MPQRTIKVTLRDAGRDRQLVSYRVQPGVNDVVRIGDQPSIELLEIRVDASGLEESDAIMAEHLRAAEETLDRIADVLGRGGWVDRGGPDDDQRDT